MTITPPPPDLPAEPSARGPSATALLADRTSRAVVLTLGEARGRSLSAPAITEQGMIEGTPRLVRDRIRDLERAGILEPEPEPHPGNTPGRWRLTAAGRDLYRLQSLLTRIVAHAAKLSATTSSGAREHVVELTLKGLSDPVVVQIARCLAAHGPLDPVGLEMACRPTPRRTLYRRLSPLVAGGVVVRTTSRQVPRSTHYELAQRWRPVAAILMLSAWWESRHRAAAGHGVAVDLEGLLIAIAPVVRLGQSAGAGPVRWVVDHPSADPVPLLLADGDRLRLESDPTDAEPIATVVGTPSAWTEALVTDQRAGLSFVGEAQLAGEVLEAVRAALLMYIR